MQRYNIVTLHLRPDAISLPPVTGTDECTGSRFPRIRIRQTGAQPLVIIVLLHTRNVFGCRRGSAAVEKRSKDPHQSIVGLRRYLRRLRPSLVERLLARVRTRTRKCKRTQLIVLSNCPPSQAAHDFNLNVFTVVNEVQHSVDLTSEVLTRRLLTKCRVSETHLIPSVL